MVGWVNRGPERCRCISYEQGKPARPSRLGSRVDGLVVKKLAWLVGIVAVSFALGGIQSWFESRQTEPEPDPVVAAEALADARTRCQEISAEGRPFDLAANWVSAAFWGYRNDGVSRYELESACVDGILEYRREHWN